VLLSLLPGLRHMRAPFVLGCCLLFAAWIRWGRHLPGPGHATGLLADLYRLAGALGSPVVLGVGAFVAYMAGSTTQWVLEWILWWVTDTWRALVGRWNRDQGSPYREWVKVIGDLGWYLPDGVVLRSGGGKAGCTISRWSPRTGYTPQKWTYEGDEVAQRRLFVGLAADLHGAYVGAPTSAAYPEVDRLRSEEELIRAVGIGSVAIVYAIVDPGSHLSFLALAAAAVVLRIRAGETRQQARLWLATAAREGRMDLPAFRQAVAEATAPVDARQVTS
jgi:hypothetical protein